MTEQSISGALCDTGLPLGTCPTCNSTALLARYQDDLAHCFNPQCGLYVTVASLAEPSAGELLFRELHTALMKDGPCIARLVAAYHLHPRVLADSMVGLVPAGFDSGALFADALRKAEENLRLAEGLPRKPGRPGKDDPRAMAEAKRARVLEQQQKAAEFFAGKAGWLAFFYTGADHGVCRIVALDATSGHKEVLNPNAGGLFNHGLFAANEPSRGLADARRRLILVTSELDVLQLQSYAARQAEAEGLRPERGFVWAAALGPVKLADVGMLRDLTRIPVLWTDSEQPHAMKRLTARLTDATSFDVIELPGRKMLDVLNDGSCDLMTAVTEATRVFRTIREVRDEIDWIRAKAGKMGHHLCYRWAADVLVHDLEDRGTLYYDGREAYIFSKEDGELTLVDPDDHRLRVRLRKYGLLPTDDVFKTAIATLRLAAEDRGTKTHVHHLSHYDRERNCVYVFDQDRWVYRISANAIERVQNGTDGALFIKRPNSSKLTITPERFPDVLPLGQTLLAGVQVRETWLTRVEQERLVETWMLAMLFPTMFPTRPILAFVGEKGSGKTSVGRAMGRIYFGPGFQVIAMESDEKDCDAAITSEPYAVLDNADRELRWIEDKLAVIATGGAIKRRRYYTTNQLVEYPITAFVAITSRTPHFRREDVADRLLVIEVERLDAFESEAERLRRLDMQRDELMTSVARRVQEILRGFAANGHKPMKTGFRMADFAEFALRGASSEQSKKDWHTTFAKLVLQQMAFTIDEDPLFGLLDEWLSQPGNVGRALSTAKLFRELSMNHGDKVPPTPFPFKNVQAFGHKLSNLSGTLRSVYGASSELGRSRERQWRFLHRAKDSGGGEPANAERAA